MGKCLSVFRHRPRTVFLIVQNGLWQSSLYCRLKTTTSTCEMCQGNDDGAGDGLFLKNSATPGVLSETRRNMIF